MTIAIGDRRHGRQEIATDIAAYGLALLLHVSLVVAIGLLHHGAEDENRQTQIELVTLPPAQNLAATSIEAARPSAVERVTPAATKAESVFSPRAASPSPDTTAPLRPSVETASQPAAGRPSAAADGPVKLAPVGAPSATAVQAATTPAAAASLDLARAPRPEAEKAGRTPDVGSTALRAASAAVPAEPATMKAAPLADAPTRVPLAPSDAASRTAVLEADAPTPLAARPSDRRNAGTVFEPARAVTVDRSRESPGPSGIAVETSPTAPAVAAAQPLDAAAVPALRPPVGQGSVTAGQAPGEAIAHAAAVPAPAVSGDERRATSVWSGDGGDVRAFLKSYDGGGCFIAVASQIAEDSFAISGFSRTTGEWVDFNRSLDTRTGYRFAAPSRQVSQAQCVALAFARRQPAYPDFALRIALESDRLRSGEDIAGRIEGLAKPHVALLLVDDEGRVQDVSALLRGSEAEGLAFRTPLTLTSGPVETVQLFVAIASASPLPTVAGDVRQTASDYFERLSQALAGEPDGVDVALAAFSVE